MNRMDRLFGLVVLLQLRSRVRADDLAAAFGVSRRTIYRDIAALSETGVPVVALPGQGYGLMEGFYLPPLTFTSAEAVALFLGARMLTQHATGRLAKAAEEAMAKLAVALPNDTREEVKRLSEVIEFFVPEARFDLDEPRLGALQQAIRTRRVVHLRYHSYAGDETTERDVEPHKLTYSGNAWYLNGFCRLRQAGRTFRLERIEHVVVSDETFDDARVLVEEPRKLPTQVRVRVGERMARWVRERQHYAFQGEEPAESRGRDVVMTYQVDALGELVPWLRSWGTDVEVLSPPELRAALREEALRLTELLT